MAHRPGAVAQLAKSRRQLMMLRDKLLKGGIPDITELQDADGGGDPCSEGRVSLLRFDGGCWIVQFVDDDPTDNLDDRFGAVDAGVVVFLKGLLKRFEGLLQHGRIRPIGAAFANGGIPIEAHRILPAVLSASCR